MKAPKAKMLLCLSLLYGFLQIGFGQIRESSFRTLEEDVVYLHNGSVIRGTITAQQLREYVEIVTFDGTRFHFAVSDIDKVTREPSKYTRIRTRINRSEVPVIFPGRGMYFGSGGSLTLNNDGANLHLMFRSGYRWRHWLETGIVSGMERYNAGLIIPIAAEVRGDAFQKPVTPHYFGQAGWGFAANRSWQHRIFDGGPYLHAGGGLTFHGRRGRSHQLSLGYKWLRTYQEFEEQPPWFWTPTQQVPPDPVLVTGFRNYRRITISLITNF